MSSDETFDERVKAVQALMEEKRVTVRARPIETQDAIHIPKIGWVDLTQPQGVPQRGLADAADGGTTPDPA
ncbi:MAG TPA: hypothetical protein VNA25_28560 [Phycisphaerae bacterium]|nr:hypothetical protein [Phycisphaerae bacterium]